MCLHQGLDIRASVLQDQQLRELHDGVPQCVHASRNQRRQEKGITVAGKLWKN